MEPVTLGWLPFVESWIPTCNPEWITDREEYVLTMFNWIVPPCLYFINKHGVQYCKPGDISLVVNMINMVEMLMNDAVNSGTKKEEQPKYMDVWFQASFIQAGILIFARFHISYRIVYF